MPLAIDRVHRERGDQAPERDGQQRARRQEREGRGRCRARRDEDQRAGEPSDDNERDRPKLPLRPNDVLSIPHAETSSSHVMYRPESALIEARNTHPPGTACAWCPKCRTRPPSPKNPCV